MLKPDKHGPNILDHQHPGIPMLAVDVLPNVEADHVVVLGEQTLSPTAEAAEQINR